MHQRLRPIGRELSRVNFDGGAVLSLIRVRKQNIESMLAECNRDDGETVGLTRPEWRLIYTGLTSAF